MDDRERRVLAAQLLEQLGNEHVDEKITRLDETEHTVREIIEKSTVNETEYIARRHDMVQISDFFCRDSRRYDSGFEVY